MVNPFVDLDQQPGTLQFAQLLLAFVFFISYALTLGSFCTRRGRWRAAFVALAAVVAFCFTVTPWTMGIVWGALAIGSMGVFGALSLLVSRLLGLGSHRGSAAPSEPLAEPAPAVQRPVPANGPAPLSAPANP